MGIKPEMWDLPASTRRCKSVSLICRNTGSGRNWNCSKETG